MSHRFFIHLAYTAPHTNTHCSFHASTIPFITIQCCTTSSNTRHGERQSPFCNLHWLL